MLARNLVFLGVLLVAGAALRASLFPLYDPGRHVTFDPGITSDADFHAVVRKVDESFREDWNSQNLTPAPRADDLTVARRLSLALTGSVPSLEEIRQFENAPPEMRLDGWVNYLLADRRSSGYLAERFARVFVGSEEGPLIVYRKRRFLAWIGEQLHKNTPYSEIVRQMIAERGLNTDAPAVNFIAATYHNDTKKIDPEKLAIRVSRAFLGLRIDCAQCHDHFLEPTWKQTDFQSLAAFFGQTRQAVTNILDDSSLEYHYEDRVTGAKHPIDAAVPFLPELLPSEGSQRERLAAWVTDPRNRYFARATVNRVWALLFNRPLTARIEAQTIDEPAPNALDILAYDFAAHGHDLHRLILLIASTEVFRLDSAASHELTSEHDRAWAAFPLTRLRPEQVIGSVIQASTLRTINQNSNVFVRLTRYANERDFVNRYGNPEDDEFDSAEETIPQRLLMLNGNLVNEKAKEDLVNASVRIALLAPSDEAAIDAAYLTVLTRRATPDEREHFLGRLANTSRLERQRRLADLFWVLFNSTELSWNH